MGKSLISKAAPMIKSVAPMAMKAFGVPPSMQGMVNAGLNAFTGGGGAGGMMPPGAPMMGGGMHGGMMHSPPMMP